MDPIDMLRMAVPGIELIIVVVVPEALRWILLTC